MELELAKAMRDFITSVPETIDPKWQIGAMPKSNLPQTYIIMINGIECFLPAEVKPIVNGRTLRLEKGRLVFNPQLELPSIRELRKSGS